MANIDRFRFMTAGRAVFTITSKRTGTSYTYRVARAEERDGREGPLFVSVLTGPDNTRDYTYMGILNVAARRVHCTRTSRIERGAPSFEAFEWFLRNVDSDRVEFRHCGRCARCGRQLTVPSSVDSGFGPECAARAAG